MDDLARTDPEVAEAIRNETRRQGAQLELIASENFVSEAVLEALGTVFTNKYAEGYPGRRYYGGCEYADVVETLAIERLKQLFGCDHANVQPHSGAQANTAVYMTVCKPGDTILGMNLSHGGHLTHGHPLNFSGRLYNVAAYGVRKEDERIDYDAILQLARQHRPKVIVVGASAYPRQVVANAATLAATLKDEGWRLVSGGTDNRLILIDAFARGLTGKVAEKALDRAGITVNKNTIPYDTNPPMVASGIRVGTPALTTRGMKEKDMEEVGRLISRALAAVENESTLADVKRDVGKLCARFPLYAARLAAYDRLLSVVRGSTA